MDDDGVHSLAVTDAHRRPDRQARDSLRLSAPAIDLVAGSREHVPLGAELIEALPVDLTAAARERANG
jgi:hypothetical protein